MALPLDAKGDITGTDKIKWSRDKGTPYVPSPILYDGFLYFNQSNQSILSCLEAKTGEILIERTRMQGLRGVDGVTLVIEKGPEFKVLATNELDEPIDSSPALAGNQLFLRSEKSLYCISQP